MVQKGTMQTYKEGRQPTVVSGYDAYESHQQTAWHNVTKGAVVVYKPQ